MKRGRIIQWLVYARCLRSSLQLDQASLHLLLRKDHAIWIIFHSWYTVNALFYPSWLTYKSQFCNQQPFLLPPSLIIIFFLFSLFDTIFQINISIPTWKLSDNKKFLDIFVYNSDSYCTYGEKIFMRDQHNVCRPRRRVPAEEYQTWLNPLRCNFNVD